MKQISYGQLLMLLFVTRIFKTMTYNPFRDTEPFIIMIAVLISVTIQCIAVIPLIIIYRKHSGDDIISLSFKKSKVLGYIISLIYGLYFIFVALRTVKYFSVFMSEAFPVINSYKAVAVVLVLVAFYAAYQGIEALGRSASVVFVLFCAMIVTIILTDQGNIDIYNFSLTEPFREKNLFQFLINELGTNFELAAIALLLPKVKNRLSKGIYGYLGLKLAVIEFAVFIAVAVLGEYVKVTELPFFKVGAFSKTQYIERFDAVYMIIWTLCAVICLGLFSLLASACFERVFKKAGQKRITFIIGADFTAIIILFNINRSRADIWFDKWLGSVFVILLTTVIPLVMLAVSGKKEKIK